MNGSGLATNGVQETPTMTLAQIAVVLIVVGVLMWLVNTYIPMMSAMKSLLNLVVIVVVVVWLLQVFGIIGPIPGVRIPRVM
jgi:hypothetical protein